MTNTNAVHPRGSDSKVLLSSVFGPFAQDDIYGSSKINPMELYHNQVTRVQGPFSLRMFHRSFGLMMIESNIEAPCRLLDFPTLDLFIDEIQNHSYDIVGISSIIPNWKKVKKMCEIVRQYLPDATIVVGGHVSNMPDIHTLLDADHIVKGDGVRWFRKFLGQDEYSPIKHPLAYSGFGTRCFGVTSSEKAGDTAAILIPSAGCPMGCNFCSTSAQFGGKNKFVNFYETGDDLFPVICHLEEKLKSRSFFVLDENFLLHKKRALRLLELMKQHNKSWVFYVFSSAGVLKSYTIEQLVGLGISWVWMGLEGENSEYAKLNNIDTRKLVQNLQSHGICVLGSTIIGLENHTPENINKVINYAVNHNTDFHQFMLYTPLPGTPLHNEYLQAGNLLSEEECPASDVHGQNRFNFRHKHIFGGQENKFLLKAFQRDFEANGPSLARMIGTMLTGWKRYKNHPDNRIRSCFTWKSQSLKITYAGAIWAMKRWYGKQKPMLQKMTSTLQGLYEEFGWKTRIIAPILGRIIYLAMKREAKRLTRGWVYEPRTVYEKNDSALVLERTEKVYDKHKFLKKAQKFADRIKHARAFTTNSRRNYDIYSYSAFERISRSTLASMELFGKGILEIKLKSRSVSEHPLIVDLQGVFDRITAIKLKKKIENHLKEHSDYLAINFSGVTKMESKALLKFLKKLKGYKERIKIVSIESFRDEIGIVLKYAQNHFEVFTNEESLIQSMVCAYSTSE